MRYQPLSSQTYINHRRKLADRLEDGAMAIINSNDIMPTNADGNMPFRQNSDLLYLCGVDQEESILVIFPSAHNKAHREILFLKETSPEIAIWEGEKLSKDDARNLTGVDSVMWIDSFETVMKTLMSEAETVLLPSNEHTRRSIVTETREERFSKWIRKEYPLHKFDRLAPHMHRLRSIKSVEEIEQMQRACKITEDGFRRILKFVRPGVMEYEIQAEYMHEFLRQRSRGFAYEPIVASGFSACVLHYISNNQECKDGDVLLMDVGCEYGNYASDMTRAIPVNGKFTPRQKEVYNAVLHVMKEAKKLLKPGVFLADYHKKVGLLMEEQLIGLGLISKEDVESQDPAMPAYKKYFMHGTSHFLGLDVHDVGLWTEPIEAGMAFTVEPGIYIREENLGIRLENDIIITEDGFVDLMKDIPLEADEIEELMQG
ncbi:MAG: aminopeptidase P N-terminal domain-containing protein [Bacteroidota bacterium]